MLRITLRDSADRVQLLLEGRLTGAWVPELEACWRASMPSLGNRELWIDLRGVDSIDDAGRGLLGLMHEAGARFLACGCMTAAVVEEITGKRPVERSA